MPALATFVGSTMCYQNRVCRPTPWHDAPCLSALIRGTFTSVLPSHDNLWDCRFSTRPLLLEAPTVDFPFACLAGGDGPSRIDYIWVSGTPEEARLTMQQAPRGCSYSDHLGIEAVCTFQDDCTDRCFLCAAWLCIPDCLCADSIEKQKVRLQLQSTSTMLIALYTSQSDRGSLTPAALVAQSLYGQ